MADPAATPKKNPSSIPSEDAPAESPTTAKSIVLDDEEDNEANTAPGTATKPPRTSSRNVRFETDEEAPPAKPPRPASPNTQATDMLKEAFPDVEKSVIRAVLVASGGKVEPAFNALLSMSDPDFKDDAPPAQPPRPTQQQSQLEQDEQYARQLAEHYAVREQHAQGQGRGAQRPQQHDEDEREYSFLQDDLPEIRENLRQGFISTQRNINKWITDFRKRLDGEDDAAAARADVATASYGERPAPSRFNFGPKQSDQLRGIQRNADRMRSRQSTDASGYDADPRVLSDNFTELELHDAEAEERPPPKPARPLANPDLFKPTPPTPGQGQTSAQTTGTVPAGPVDEIDALYGETTTGAKASTPASGGKSKKWQPLTSIAPAPAEADDDPFKLNSDDEDDVKDKSEDVAKDATERLKRASLSKDAGQSAADDKKPEEKEDADKKETEALVNSEKK